MTRVRTELDLTVIASEAKQSRKRRNFDRGISDYIKKRRIEMLSDFYKNQTTDRIWWIDDLEQKGAFLFSFDQKRILNLFADYPHALTNEQKEVFDRENPYWTDYFRDR